MAQPRVTTKLDGILTSKCSQKTASEAAREGRTYKSWLKGTLASFLAKSISLVEESGTCWVKRTLTC